MTSMRVLVRFTAVFAVLLCLALPAQAQAVKWWTSDQYVHELGLTQDQSRRIEEIFQAAVPNLRAQKKTLDEAEQQFQAMMQRNNYSAVMEVVDHLETARAALNRSRTLMLVNMRHVLTKDQWIKLDAMHQAAEQRKNDTAHSNK